MWFSSRDPSGQRVKQQTRFRMTSDKGRIKTKFDHYLTICYSHKSFCYITMQGEILMKMLSRIAVASLLVSGITFASATTASVSQKNDTTLISQFNTAVSSAPLLYALSAESATVTPIPNKSNMYKLVLSNPGIYVGYFSDRPQRIAGAIPMQYFVDNWGKGKDNFVENPPNVAFHGASRGTPQGGSYIFELSNLNYDSSKNILTFNAQLLSGNKILNQFGPSSLFIDITWINTTP